MLRDRILGYLERHTTLNLATEGPQGLWAAAVWYVHDGIDLYFTSVAATRHAQNMLATRRIAGTINDDSSDWMTMQGVQLDGTVTPVDSIADRRRVVAAYLAKFPGAVGLWNGETDPDAIARDPGIHGFYRIAPQHVFFMDNTVAPGVREELRMA
jgi:uncharacterized protein